MFKNLGSLLLFFWGSFLSAGSITAKVDTEEILRGDSVLLTITMTGENIDEIPDIEEMNGFKVEHIQRRTGHNYVTVNGVAKMEKTQVLTLEFRPQQSTVIAPFSVTIDGVLMQTKAVSLTVLDSPSGTKRSNPNFALEMKINKNKIYLGEPILVHIYFKQRTALDVTQLQYEAPKFKGFFAKQVKKEKTYVEGIYTVHELNYVLIAKDSGVFQLDPAHAKVAQRSRELQPGGWYVDVPKWTQIASSTLEVQVLKGTQQYDIVGNYILKVKIDKNRVELNKPVKLSVTLLGEGSLEDYSGLSFKIPSVTLFPDSAEIKSELKGEKLYSRYQQTFVFVSNHNFEIPEKTIKVYDYKSNSIKILKTKKYQIKVIGEDNNTIVTPLTLKDIKLHGEKGILEKIREKFFENIPSLLPLGLSFLLGILVTLLFQIIKFPTFFKKKKRFDAYEAWQILYPKISESKEVEEVVRQLYAIKSGESNVQLNKELLRKLMKYYKEEE